MSCRLTSLVMDACLDSLGLFDNSHLTLNFIVKIVYVPKPVEKKENVTADENAALQMAKAPVEVA